MIHNNTTSNSPNMPDPQMFPRTHLSAFVCLGILGAFIVLANALVIYLYKQKAFLRTKTNLCLVCLAVSDMLAGLIAVPMVILCNLAEVDGLTFQYICTAMDLSSRFISISTVLHLLLVTMERYCLIIHGMHYPFIVTKSRIMTVLACVWLFSLTASLIQLTWIPFGQPNTEDVFKKDTIYSLTVFFGVVLPSLFTMGTVLACIFRVLRRQLKSIKRDHIKSYKTRAYRRAPIPLESKAILVFGSMLVTFIACWFSYFLDGLTQDLQFGMPQLPNQARVVLMFLRFSSSVINPLLYTFFKEDFKRAFRASFRITERSSNLTTWDTTPV